MAEVKVNTSVAPVHAVTDLRTMAAKATEKQTLQRKDALIESKAEREKQALVIKTLMAEKEKQALVLKTLMAEKDSTMEASCVLVEEKEKLALENSIVREDNSRLAIKELSSSQALQALQENQEEAEREHNAQLRQLEGECRKKVMQWDSELRAMEKHFRDVLTFVGESKDNIFWEVEEKKINLENMWLLKEDDWKLNLKLMAGEIEMKLQTIKDLQLQVLYLIYI